MQRRIVAEAATAFGALSDALGTDHGTSMNSGYYGGQTRSYALYVVDTAGESPPAYSCYPPAGIVTTLAGSGTNAFADGTGTAASLNYVPGVAVSPDGETLYVADYQNHRIRTIDTSTGVVTTLAGSGTSGAFADDTGTAASFDSPTSVAVSPDGETLYVADFSNHRIRTIVVDTGVVTTLAGSGDATFADDTGTAASFSNPIGVAVSPDGETVYVADQDNHRIRTIDTSTGVVTTLAGSGTSGAFADDTGTAASFDNPHGVAVSPDGETLYVADFFNHRIRTIVVDTGVVTTLAGSGALAFTGTSGAFADGTGTAASFRFPPGVAVSPNGLTVYVADYQFHPIRQVTT